MAISDKLKALLEGAGVKYTVAKHPAVYTAQEIAAAQHVPGRQLAKCVLVKTEGGPVLAVLPAIHLVGLKRLKALLGAKTLSIGKEADIKARFPDVEVGAMSPFGNLYGVPVVVDRALSGSETIVFNAGTHTDTISMGYADFARLVQPKVGDFGQPLSPPTPAKKAAARKGAPRRRAAKQPQARKPARKKQGGAASSR